MANKYCYLFTEGNANMRELLGGKGANLAEMTNIGLPVPQGFTISTEACTQYYEDGRRINDAIQAEIAAIKQSINDINADITAIEADVKAQVEAINKSISDLDAELAAEVKKVTDGYTAAISTAKTEITAAYTTAIATARYVFPVPAGPTAKIKSLSK